MDVYDALARARANGERVALVTVVAVSGEVPSHPGAKLVVGPERVLAGTLGCSEFDTAGADLARRAMHESTALRSTFPSPTAERTIELFAEVHEPEPAVLILGSNPVARSLADLARSIGRRTVLIAPGGDTAVRGGVEVRADDPERALLAAPPGPDDAVVISDHEAAWVEAALRVALASDAYFVGMLGSRRHAPAAVRRLTDAGVPAAHLARLRSPCGLDIGSRTAEEIALSILAEIVAVERDRTGGPMTLAWGQP